MKTAVVCSNKTSAVKNSHANRNEFSPENKKTQNVDIVLMHTLPFSSASISVIIIVCYAI